MVLVKIYHGKSTKSNTSNTSMVQNVAIYICLMEKIFIICVDSVTLLNKKTELNSKCRLRKKVLLANVRR